jgi:4-carboxymuconolactone decarboxylase
MSDPNSISRLGGVSEASNDPILADIFARILAKRGRLLNIHQVVGHAPKMLQAQAAYAAALREESSLPRSLQELLILRVAQMNASDYEQSVHRPIAISCGVTPEKIAALASWQSSSLFDAKERTALAFVEQAAGSGEVADSVFAAAKKEFGAQQIVELAALVGWYVGNSRFVRALRIASESERGLNEASR